MPGVPVTLATGTVGTVTIEAVQGDITQLDVDAITNAANDHLWMGAGVAGAIKARGGVPIEREAMAKGPVPVGSAVETSGGCLAAAYVIHGAVMGQDLKTDLSTVARTTRAVLELAGRLGLSSVAIPLLGTGVGGLGAREVASTMYDEVAAMVVDGRCAHMRVLLVAYDDEAARALVEVVGRD
jgi:O-acetyl-ADP-ribose deacetylase (regulator of RNase III)